MNASEISKIKYLSARESDLTAICHSSALYADISEEIVLPEYISDVRRVLMSDSAVVYNECTVADSKIEAEGKVCVNILLSTDMGDVKGYSVSLPYSAVSQPIDGGISVSGHLCMASIEQSSAKLTNSRKISVKCRIKIDVRAYSKIDSLPAVTGCEKEEDESYVERDTDAVEVMKIVSDKSENFAISDDIELENSLCEIEDILFCRAGAVSCSCRAADGGGVMCDGEMEITVFYISVDKKLQSITRREKYSAMCALDNTLPNCEYAANLYVNDIHASVSKNSFGENRIIELDISGCLFVFAAANTVSEITTDAYSTEHNCQNRFADFKCPSLLRLSSSQFTQSVSKPLSELSAKTPAKIVCSSASLHGAKFGYDSDRQRAYLEGMAEISVLAQDAEGEIYPIGFGSPIKYDIDVPECNNIDAVCTMNASNVSAHCDGNKIYCDFNVCALVFVSSDNDRHILSECALGERKRGDDGKKSSMTVCYGRAGERLWDIAKHYSTTIEAVANANGISGDRLASDSIMIIPQKKKGVTKII